MTDPYRIINVSPAASSFKLRRAYRRERKRYKPIPFHDEQLKKLSQSRYNTIADAYQSILAERQEHSTRRNDQSGELPCETLSEIRELIDTDVDLADYKLRHLPVIEQNAEWHYLMSIVLCKRFYYIDGQKMLRRACELDPKNQEYLDTRKELNEKVKKYYKHNFFSSPTSDSCGESCCECGGLCCCEGGCECIADALGSC